MSYDVATVLKLRLLQWRREKADSKMSTPTSVSTASSTLSLVSDVSIRRRPSTDTRPADEVDDQAAVAAAGIRRATEIGK